MTAGGRKNWAGPLGVFFLTGAIRCVAGAEAEPNPVMFRTAPGRFEVAAIDPLGAQQVVAEAEEAWRLLAAPLGLPEGFSSPVFVRLVPDIDWPDRAPFRIVAEAGGVVSVRVRWTEATPKNFVRRALVQGLLLRLAVAEHGIGERLTVPLWLELASVGWWETRADAAQLDALRQESAGLAPPRMDELFAWQRGEPEPRVRVAGAVWLLAFFQTESAGRTGELAGFLRRLLGGESAEAALAASYPGRFATAEERELWWQTGWHHLRRTRTLPTIEAAESRALLEELARSVFLRAGRDEVVMLRETLAHAREPGVDADLKRRVAELNRALPALHPFYRNAGLSLAAALAARTESAEKISALCGAFEQDWRDAGELAAATAAALDAVERRREVAP